MEGRKLSTSQHYLRKLGDSENFSETFFTTDLSLN